MSDNTITDALADGRLICDGASGSVLDAWLGDGPADRNLLPLERPLLVARLCAAYLEAGADIIKTATFNTSARELAAAGSVAVSSVAASSVAASSVAASSVAASSVAAGTGDAVGLSRGLNAAAARICRAEADAAASRDGRKRWVAGSVGPGSAAACLGATSYAELRASYLPQMLGLIEGGADFALIETVQDTIQCKAAISALFEAEAQSGVRLPFVVSATLDDAGRMLCGAGAESFAAIVEPFGPAAIGLNCSGGPAQLARALETLARRSSVPLSFMPNAGMPAIVSGKAAWPLGPAEFAAQAADLAERFGAALVGGCCGTGPDHIAALRRAMSGRSLPGPRPKRGFSLSSVRAAASTADGTLVVDERANAAGSAAFRAILCKADPDLAAQFVLDRGSRGTAAVDICVAGAPEGEELLLPRLIAAVSPVMEAAVSIDTIDPSALAASLPAAGGKPLVNSVNLEDPGRAAAALRLARAHGAAVVLLAVDGRGPARAAADKIEVCSRLYELAAAEGIAPEDMAFDACTMPAAAGDDRAAIETLAAVRELRTRFPSCAAVLGVGNVSFGLPKARRPAFTARFLRRAERAGLNVAIVDPSVIDLEIPDAQAELIDAVLDGGGADAIEAYLRSEACPEPVCVPAAAGGGGILERLGQSVSRGRCAEAETLALGAAEAGSGDAEIAAALGAAMLDAAGRFEAGLTALPVVMRSAEAARSALHALRAARGAGAPGRPRLVMATVKGDLHDIGKNLASLVFEASGYEVLDLGTDRSASDIAAAAAQGDTLAVGVSGLLTRSLAEMEAVASALAIAAPEALLICGGAAASGEYVDAKIGPLLPGRVSYAKDPFAALETLASARIGRACGGGSPDARGAQGPALAGRRRSRPAPPDAPAGASPDEEGSLTLADLVAALDENFVVAGRWKYPLAQYESGRRALAEALRALASAGLGTARYALADCLIAKPDADTVELVRADRDCAAAARFGFPRARFGFPREASGGRRSAADYFPAGGRAAVFFVTMGAEAAAWARGLKEAGDAEAYVRAYGLLAGLTEAAAETVHAMLRRRAGAAAGKRYSFGLPGCPGVEANGDLALLAGASAIGIGVTEGGQLDPEFSVSAVASPDPQSQYVTA